MARCPQETINGMSERANHLLHPRAAGLGVDAGDLYAARPQLDHEEHEVRLRPASVSTSTVKKSAAARPAQCASKNVFQGVR